VGEAVINWVKLMRAGWNDKKFFQELEDLYKLSPAAQRAEYAKEAIREGQSRPFGDQGPGGAASVSILADWLVERGLRDVVISDTGYTVRQLITDLSEIEGNISNDGIDAMGDDA
jgi:hypothetical protein